MIAKVPKRGSNIPSFVYLDRYRNDGTRTYSNHAAYTEAHNKYRPDTIYQSFDLILFEVPYDQMIVYSANPPRELAYSYIKNHKVMFAIHPQVLKLCSDDPYVQRTLSFCTGQKQISVIPSSSTRTLYVEDQIPPHAIKIHFPFKVSRYTRKMRDEVLEQAINVSKELENGIGKLDDRFAFLREPIALVHKNLQPDSDRGENWGYLVREMTPFPHVDKKSQLIPGFALYGKDYFDPNASLLLYDLIGDSNPVLYILENIMLPIIRHWVDCFIHFGYLLEPHGQNVILEVDENDTVSRIVHRDLSVGIDMRRRRDIRLTCHQLNQYNRMEDNAFHSIAYDKFMGGHFFDRLVTACLEKYPDLSRENFTRPCLEEFDRIFPEHAKYFPKTVWYFSEKRDQFNKPLYQDTGLSPIWRP
jgi:hypothetical protein